MTRKIETRIPSQVIQEQHVIITAAIRMLREASVQMTDEVDPETDSWRDVSRFAHIVDPVRDLLKTCSTSGAFGFSWEQNADAK